MLRTLKENPILRRALQVERRRLGGGPRAFLCRCGGGLLVPPARDGSGFPQVGLASPWGITTVGYAVGGWVLWNHCLHRLRRP